MLASVYGLVNLIEKLADTSLIIAAAQYTVTVKDGHVKIVGK
jgi:hypothetical protein